MTWMDSYYRVQSLTTDMMDCNQDLRDFVEEVTYILRTGSGVGPLIWAVSSWLALVDYINSNRIHKDIDYYICVGACKAIGMAVQGTVDKYTSKLDINEEDKDYD